MRKIMISVLALVALTGCTHRYDRLPVEDSDIECDVKYNTANGEGEIYNCVQVVEVTPEP